MAAGSGRLWTRVWGVGHPGVAREAEAEAEAEEKKGIAACFEMETSLIGRLAYLQAKLMNSGVFFSILIFF